MAREPLQSITKEISSIAQHSRQTRRGAYSPLADDKPPNINQKHVSKQSSWDDNWFFEAPRKEQIHIKQVQKTAQNDSLTPSPDYSMDSCKGDNQMLNGRRETEWKRQRTYLSQISDYSSGYGVNHDYEHQWPPNPQDNPMRDNPINSYFNYGRNHSNEFRNIHNQGGRKYVRQNPLFTDSDVLPNFQKRIPHLDMRTDDHQQPSQALVSGHLSPIIGGRRGPGRKGLPRYPEDRIVPQYSTMPTDLKDPFLQTYSRHMSPEPHLINGFRDASPQRNMHDEHIPPTGFLSHNQHHRSKKKYSQQDNKHHEDGNLYQRNKRQFNEFGEDITRSLGNIPGPRRYGLTNGYDSNFGKFGSLTKGAKNLVGAWQMQ